MVKTLKKKDLAIGSLRARGGTAGHNSREPAVGSVGEEVGAVEGLTRARFLC